MRQLIDPRTSTVLSLPAVFAGVLIARRMLSIASSTAPASSRRYALDRLERASGELGAQPTGVPVGHLDETLFGVMKHEPPPERPGSDRPPEADDDVERVFRVSELEREPRRRAQARIGQRIACAGPEHIARDVLDLLEDPLDAIGVATFRFGELTGDHSFKTRHELLEFGSNRLLDPPFELLGKLARRSPAQLVGVVAKSFTQTRGLLAGILHQRFVDILVDRPPDSLLEQVSCFRARCPQLPDALLELPGARSQLFERKLDRVGFEACGLGCLRRDDARRRQPPSAEAATPALPLRARATGASSGPTPSPPARTDREQLGLGGSEKVAATPTGRSPRRPADRPGRGDQSC